MIPVQLIPVLLITESL